MRLASKPLSEIEEALLLKKAQSLIEFEYGLADKKYGPFHSTHEAYGVIKEEVDELWDAIKANNNPELLVEAVQVGAMALTLVISILRGNVNEQHLLAGNNRERQDDAGQDVGKGERPDLREFGGHSAGPDGRERA